jgi:hypothetical protein
MATYYSQGDGAWSTLTNWDTNAGGGGSDPASVAAMDDQTFVIQANHTITLDVDISGHANGIAGLTITSHATTPGMLVCKNTTGTYGLKIKTGTTIAGTNAATKGRILANSDKTWGNTGDLPADVIFLISLNTTAYIDATYLDIALYDTEPANKFVETYATKYTCTEASTDVNPATNLITFAEATPPAAGTAVIVRSAGSLPGGLTTTDVYYVRSITDLGATFTCALALQNSDATIVDLTSAGSGALYMYSGHTNTSTATMNVIQDVTGDAQWASGASVVLVDSNAPEAYDQQRVTLNGAPNAGNMTLSANVDSAQYPGAKIFLMTRNVAIRSSCATAVNIVSYSSGATHGGVFKCEIRSTAGTGTTFYGTGVNYGVSCTLSGTVSGCTYGTQSGTSHEISGIVAACSNGIQYGSACTISGTIAGCAIGIANGTAHNLSGEIIGSSIGASAGMLHTISGNIIGCNVASQNTGLVVMSGSVRSCNEAMRYPNVHKWSGVISGCASAFRGGVSSVLSGQVVGCGSIFTFQASDGSYSLIGNNIIVLGKATCAASFTNRNLIYGGDQQVYFEDYGGVLGAQYAAWAQGDVIKNTSTLRSGGAASSIEVIPLSTLGSGGFVRFFDWTELAVPTGNKTKTIYIRADAACSVYPTNVQLYFEAEYLNHLTLLTTATIASTEVLSDGSTWTAFTVTFNPLQVGPVRYRGYLKWYEASRKIYVDNAIYTS